MSETSPKTDAQSPKPASSLMPVLALALAAAVGCMLVMQIPGLSRHDRLVAGSGLIAGAILVWLAAVARFNRVLRVILGCVCLAPVCWLAALRTDGYDGDGSPRYVWRWQPTAEQVFVAARSQAQPSQTQPSEQPGGAPPGAGAGAGVDLTIQLGDYPGFLGLDRQGVVSGVKLERDWQSHPPKLLWRKRVGSAWSSLAVANGFAVTQEQRGPDEAVVCYELRSGLERWVHLDAGARFSETYGGDGPRATPTIADGRVYSLGATGRLNCLAGKDGQAVWSADILQDAKAGNLSWGMSGSPLVFDQVVVVAAGGAAGNSLVAYDRETGKVRWHAGDERAGYSSPMLADLGGVRQILNFNARGLSGHSVETGEQLWQHAWVTTAGVNAAQPLLVTGNRVLISSGYGHGCALLEVKREGSKFTVQETFAPNTNLKSKFSNVALREGYAYGLDEQILVCLDLSDGSRKWKARGGKYGHGQMLLVDDLLLVQAEPGFVALVEASPSEFREVTRFEPLTEKTWNHPVLVGQLLIVRNDREAACYELPVVSGNAK